MGGIYECKTFSLSSWHKSFHYHSTHTITKWCLRATSPSPSGNWSHITSWCQSPFNILAICIPHNHVPYQSSTHTIALKYIPVSSSFWSIAQLSQTVKIWVFVLPFHQTIQQTQDGTKIQTLHFLKPFAYSKCLSVSWSTHSACLYFTPCFIWWRSNTIDWIYFLFNLTHYLNYLHCS
jgi:hypothetical protein